MGTGFKGDAIYFRSVGQNLLSASSKYEYRNGRFGEKSSHGNAGIRIIKSENNLKTAEDFYNRLTYGGMEKTVDGNLKITCMADGTIITRRKISHSDGTPAVDINIERSTHTGGLKKQKIHFVRKEK